ncbi:NEL-type E3 ubiquitin ligase domain-containing protein [Pseudomonas guariconensis]|uniref:NEL-type E3 ubiquitin ligase domain-containing protein n=1 Tax=Pseudomonas guariconensis TaxID=1288410 RepID=UPI00300D56E4
MSLSHFSFIDARLPGWLKSATPAQRQRLEQHIRQSHQATRALDRALKQVQPIDDFCRPLLDDAMSHWYPDRELPAPDQGWLWNNAEKRDMSWLEAALQNFDSDTSVTLYLSKNAPGPMAVDSTLFVKGARNLDLGQRYRNHLAEHVDTPVFRSLVLQQDRTAFEADTTMAELQKHLDSQGRMLADAALTGESFLLHSDGKPWPLECGYLELCGTPLYGPLLIRQQPIAGVEPCLLYLPGHPRQPLRQYGSLRAAGKALTRLLRKDNERRFFMRYVAHAEQPGLATQLRQTLFPRYPYKDLQTVTPVLEEGHSFNWLKRLFPAPRDLWQPTLDKNARLPLAFKQWPDECFSARARTRVELMLRNAADIAVPVAQRDAAAQLARIEGWLGVGLSVLNMAGFFVPGLAEVMLVIGGAQLVDEFLEGVHAANESDADAAIGHLFSVVENLLQVAALGAAGQFIEPQGTLHAWSRIGHGDQQRLWHGNLEPFARTSPPQLPPNLDPYLFQGRHWITLDGRHYPVEATPEGGWRLCAAKGHRHQPSLLGNGEGTWLLDHERPLAWDDDTLLRRLGPAIDSLDTSTLRKALRCSGYETADLRQTLVEHRPLPALLLESLEAFGAAIEPRPAVFNQEDALLAQDFPSLSPTLRREILAQARPRDLSQMQRTGRIPLNVSETARLYLRASRINRALVAFHQASDSLEDRDALVFGALQRLCGWSGQLHLELREGRLGGSLLETAGAAQAPLKILVRRADGYEPFDKDGQSLANRDNLFRAILQALPDSERDNLGLQIHESETLRDRLFDLATADREQAARDLGMQPVRPWYRLPTRLPGSPRLGYALSGRGRGWLTADEQFDQLFPSNLDNDRETLRARLREQTGHDPIAFNRLMQNLRDQYRQLDSTLQGWVHDTDGIAADEAQERRTARQATAERIRRAWRRENNDANGSLDEVILSIDAEYLGALPSLPVQLPQVRQLNVTGLWRGGTDSLGAFLAAFPQVRELELSENGLYTLPEQLGGLTDVQLLDLSENNLDLSIDANLSILGRLTKLRALNLSSAIGDLPVAALEQLAQLPNLMGLQAEMNELFLGAEHFQALQRWPALVELSLGHNDITLDNASRAALAQLSRLRILFLQENPLDLAPDITGWTHLERLDLEQTGIAEWPAGIEALLGQRPLTLRAVDLSNNQLHDAPDLRDSAFAVAVRAGEAEMYHAFQNNPFSEQALQRLNDAGLPTAARVDHLDWLAAVPQAVGDHVAATLQEPEWRPLYELFRRVEDTRDYQASPNAMRRRMHVIVERLSAREGDNLWGQAQVHERIIDLINEAAHGCVDQASLLFQQVETQVLVWQQSLNAAPGDASDKVAISICRSLLRQQLLDERISNLYDARVARRKALIAGRSADETPLHAVDDISDTQLREPTFLLDELEMALHARMRLRERLELPPQPGEISFDYLAQLSPATLDQLAQMITTQADIPRLVQWADEQPFWRDWIKRLRQQAFEHLANEWDGASAYFDTLSEPGEVSTYTGPQVPPSFIDALERERPDIAWRQNGAVQRIDLVSSRYRDEGALYNRAAQLLLQTRRDADTALIRQLTETLAKTYLA